jgi:hypothetical protein
MRLRMIHKQLTIILATTFSVVLLPIILYVNFKYSLSETDMLILSLYIRKWEFLFLPLLVIGTVIVGLVTMVFFYQPYTTSWLWVSILPEIVFIAYTILFSDLFNYTILAPQAVVVINLSLLYNYYLLVPVFIIVRNVYYYYVKRS